MQTIQAGEVGKQLVFDIQAMTPGNLATLTGGTLTLVVTTPAGNATSKRFTYPATVGVAATINGVVYAAGSYGSYLTSGTDFPTAGVYQVQLWASFNSGAQLFKSPVVQLQVDASL